MVATLIKNSERNNRRKKIEEKSRKNKIPEKEENDVEKNVAIF